MQIDRLIDSDILDLDKIEKIYPYICAIHNSVNKSYPPIMIVSFSSFRQIIQRKENDNMKSKITLKELTNHLNPCSEKDTTPSVPNKVVKEIIVGVILYEKYKKESIEPSLLENILFKMVIGRPTFLNSDGSIKEMMTDKSAIVENTRCSPKLAIQAEPILKSIIAEKNVLMKMNINWLYDRQSSI